MSLTVDVIIPAYNEEQSIGKVVAEIPKQFVREIVVVSNASTDQTEAVARKEGATVLQQPQKGYGAACLKGIGYLKAKASPPDVVVFLDGDYSDFPQEMIQLVAPIETEGYDMVIGSRELGEREAGAMMPQQIFGNWLATTLIRFIYGYRFSDLGPFRAIKWDALMQIDMVDTNFGWTVEMQIKAAKHKLRCTEVAVNYRNRIGQSKVTGTVYGSVMAGYKILYTIFKYAF